MEKDNIPQGDDLNLHNKKKSKGVIFAVIITLLVVSLTGLGVWYWQQQVLKDQKAEQQKQIDELKSKVDQLTEAAKESEKAETKQYTTKYEKLNFTYPADFVIVDESEPKNANNYTAMDKLKIISPGGLMMSIQTGVYGVGGACEECKGVLAEPITVLGKNRFLNFTDLEGKATAGLSDKADQYINFIDGKNITVDNNPTLMSFNLSYSVPKLLKDYQADPALKQFKDLLTSINY